MDSDTIPFKSNVTNSFRLYRICKGSNSPLTIRSVIRRVKINFFLDIFYIMLLIPYILIVSAVISDLNHKISAKYSFTL